MSEVSPITQAEERRSHISTFFFQGNGASRGQAATYAGPEGVTVISEEGDQLHSYARNAPRLLHNLYVYPELTEVDYSYWNPLMWLFLLVNYVRNWWKGVSGPSHGLRFWQMNVGGANDVRQHQMHLRAFLQKTKQEKQKAVLFGCSRGAATTLVSVAGLSAKEQQEIALVIVEAPFDTLPDVLAASAWIPSFLQLFLLGWLGRYDPRQASPLDAMETFPLNVPVAFITSEADTRVPPACTERLIKKLGERGHRNIHSLSLKRSPHDRMPMANAADRAAYTRFLAVLYDNYCRVRHTK